MPSFMPVPSAWFVPLTGALSPMISGESVACTHTGVVSRNSQTSPVLQSPSTAHGFGAKSVEHPTRTIAKKIDLIRPLSQTQNVGNKAEQGPHSPVQRSRLQNKTSSTIMCMTSHGAHTGH